jgi:hypothetical protein
MMEIALLRKDGKGIQGSYDNADHHAQQLLPYIEALEPLVPSFGFKLWLQGHNVHVFTTYDDRKFDIVPYANETGYVGIQFRLRLSRSKAIPLLTLIGLKGLRSFVSAIKLIAESVDHNQAQAGKIQHSQG